MASPSPARIGVVGRQPVIDYLTKDYAGFRQGMLDQIPLLFPRWTDRGEADFGVVLIELFAYVADILSYYQDRVANESFLSTATQRRSVNELLRLIGYQIDPGLSASALIHFNCPDDLTIAGSDLPYTIKTAPRPGEPDVTFEIVSEFTLRGKNSRIDVSGPLAASTASIRIARGGHALVQDDVIYFEQGGPAEAIVFRRSPQLRVTGVTRVTAEIDEIRWLPPLLETLDSPTLRLHGNNVPATHGETVTHEPLFIGDGTPGQSFTLERGPVSHRLKSDPARRRSAAELEVRVNGALWQEVESFFASAPHDTHYTRSIDENDLLTVTFGTGRRGSAPPAGAVVTAQYRIGLGVAGNVTSDALTVADPKVAGILSITNPFTASGGADRESTDEARISGPGSVIAQDRAVTLEDYRLLALAFAGIAKARARVGLRGGYKVVQVFIVPQGASGENPVPAPPDVKHALKRHLEDRMPINRMAGVEVFDGAYVPVDVIVAMHLRADGSRSQVHEQARQIVTDALSLSRREFGEPVRAGELFAALFPIEGVAFVQLERLVRGGTEPPRHECAFADVPIAEHEIAVEGVVLIKPIGGLA
jgi:hypothetical protein